MAIENLTAETLEAAIAKVDTEAERLAGELGVRAIPTLMAFRDAP